MKRFIAAVGALALLVAPLSLEAADDTLKRDRFGNPVSGGTNGADEIRVFKVNDDGSLDVTIIGGGGGGTVTQGPSGSDTDPWNVMLRRADGTEIGTAAVPIRTDPTGTTTQPVEGTVADGAAASGNPVQTGGKTSAGTMQTFLTDANGAQVFASDQTGADNVANSDIAGVITPPGTTVRRLGVATYYLDAGGAWDRTRGNETDGALVNLGANNDVVIQDTAGSPGSVRLSDGTVFYKATTPSDTQPISAGTLPLPTGATTETTLLGVKTDTAIIAGDTTSIDGKTPALGQAVSASSVPVVLASDQSVISIDDNAGSLSVDDGGAVLSVDDAGGTISIDDGGGSITIDGTLTLAGDLSDLDSGAGTDDHDTIAIGLPSAGGHVIGGTATDPFRTDPTGTTTQPISDAGGSLTIDDGGSPISVDDNGGSLTVDATSLPLPTGAATEATSASIDTDTSTIAGDTTSIDGKTPSLGQAVMVSSVPVAIASDQLVISVDDNAGSLTVDDGGAVLSVDDAGGSLTVDGTVTSNAGTGTFTNQQTNVTEDYDTSGTTETMTKWGIALPASGGSVAGGTSTNPIRTDPTGTTTQPVSDGGGSLTIDGTITVGTFPDNEPFDVAQIAGTATSVNAGNADAGTQRVVITTDQAVLSIDDNAGTLTVDDGGTTLSIDDGGTVISIDDAGGSLTVDGTITANVGTTGGLSLEATQTDVELNTDTGTAMDHKAVVVGTSATLILAADTTRRSVLVTNAFTDLVAIGNSDVTLNTVVATDGLVLASSGAANDGTGGSVTLDTTAAIYAIGASASSKVILIWETD